MCFLWNSIKIHFSPPGKVDPGSQRVCHSQGSEVTEHTEPEITVGCLSLQTPTFKKPRSRTSTAERGGIWAASTQNCRTYRGSWWRTSRRCCREERRFPVSVCHLCSGQTEPWWEFSLCTCAYPAPSQPPFTFFLPLLSPPHSTRLQGQQLVQPVKKVQKRCQVSEYPLHLCQAGSWRCLFHHAHCLRTLLVALREEREKEEGGGGAEVGKWAAQSLQTLRKAVNFD